MQYSRVRHLWQHLVFPGLCIIVICGTYDFLQKPAIIQKFKMADLDSFHYDFLQYCTYNYMYIALTRQINTDTDLKS